MKYTESTIKVSVPKVKKYMRSALDNDPYEYDTYKCWEINMTQLAENAAQEFNYYEGDDIPEAIFEIALEVSEERDWFNVGNIK